jgi:hypothetical protein
MWFSSRADTKPDIYHSLGTTDCWTFTSLPSLLLFSFSICGAPLISLQGVARQPAEHRCSHQVPSTQPTIHPVGQSPYTAPSPLFARTVPPCSSCGSMSDMSSARYFSTGASVLRSAARSSAGSLA